MEHSARSATARFFLFVLALALLAGLFSFFAQAFEIPKQTSQSTSAPRPITVVIDAGHGGEDGGAVSASGIYEKDLNLAIAKQLCDLLTANGVTVVMTRTTDTLLYDRNVDYHGRKKALDLAARRRIAEETENAIFVSIHMNAYPLPQYSGLQVWYSKHHPESHTLADTLQSNAQRVLQPQNNRKTKAAGSNIYLLHHLTCPAILVECGFLSNAAEAEQLNTPEYQKELAFVIALAILEARDQ
ncbi:MAG: N-acetylmuramoyl-L-alanine amidase [Clostridia bacterium]|nr:N-acetylmuramoyl-L-alanine amidase [Clostridia bacterium]